MLTSWESVGRRIACIRVASEVGRRSRQGKRLSHSPTGLTREPVSKYLVGALDRSSACVCCVLGDGSLSQDGGRRPRG